MVSSGVVEVVGGEEGSRHDGKRVGVSVWGGHASVLGQLCRSVGVAVKDVADCIVTAMPQHHMALTLPICHLC